MKIRNGFVSNSSTSSFVIHFPKNLNEEQMRIIIEKHIGFSDSSCLLKGFKQSIIDALIECKGEKIDAQKKLELEKKYLENGDVWGSQKRVDTWQDIVNKDFDVYHGGFSDDEGDFVHGVLCNTYFKINEENFFMANERY